MKLFKLTVICGSVLSLAGCLSAPTTPDTTDSTYKPPAMSAAYVDLLIEKAKAEERARVMAELAEQNKDDKRFSEIKINQLESKIEQLNEPRQVIPEQNMNQSVKAPDGEQPVAESQTNTSADPLLEQWKNIYAQEEQKSTPVEAPPVETPKNTDVAMIEESTVKPTEIAPVKEEVNIELDYEVVAEEPVVSQSSYMNTTEAGSFDTVIRQCVASQTIPNSYSGSLPEILNSNAQAGDSIKLPTLCKWSRTPEIIMKLQEALSERGFLKPSPPHDLEVIDGIWGVNTLNSLIDYQKSKSLAYGQLSIESLVDLGIIQYSDIVNRTGSKKMLKSEVPPDVGSVEKAQPTVVPEQKIKPVPEVAPKPEIVPVPEVTPEPVKQEVKAVVVPESTPKTEDVKEVKPEVKTESKASSSKEAVTFTKAETGNCYVNQVIPGDYRGKIAELVENSRDSKVGYVQELPTLCKKDRSKEIITKLQRALYGLGYLKGSASSVNGVWDKKTLNAVRAYQKEKGLAYGQLSIEVLESLGVL